MTAATDDLRAAAHTLTQAQELLKPVHLWFDVAVDPENIIWKVRPADAPKGSPTEMVGRFPRDAQGLWDGAEWFRRVAERHEERRLSTPVSDTQEDR